MSGELHCPYGCQWTPGLQMEYVWYERGSTSNNPVERRAAPPTDSKCPYHRVAGHTRGTSGNTETLP